MSEMENPTVLKRQVDRTMTLADRVRLSLQSYGTQTIYVSLSDFSAKVGEAPYLVYQTLYRFAKNREIEIITESRDGKSGTKNRNKILGFKLLKLEPSREILGRAISKVEQTEVPKRRMNKISSQIPTILEYREKRTVVDNIRQQLRSAGFDPDQVLNLPTETKLAEEAMILFDAWNEAMSTISSLQIKIGLMERNGRKAQEPQENHMNMSDDVVDAEMATV